MNSVTVEPLGNAPHGIYRLLMLHLLQYNTPFFQVGTHGLIRFIITATYHLAFRDAEFFRAMGFLL